MIDPARGTGTEWNAGREDRAMLESNPSARTGAEASRGASLPNDRPLLPIACFGEKAINSPQDRPPRHTGGTYVTISGAAWRPIVSRGGLAHRCRAPCQT